MIRIKNDILEDIYFEICEEQNIDIDSCEVYVEKIDDKSFPYALYVKTKSMKEPKYFGDDLTQNCFNNYEYKAEHKEKYELLFDKVKRLFDDNEIIFHAVNRKGIVLTELYHGEKEFISWEDIFYNAIEHDKENKIENKWELVL